MSLSYGCWSGEAWFGANDAAKHPDMRTGGEAGHAHLLHGNGLDWVGKTEALARKLTEVVALMPAPYCLMSSLVARNGVFL